MAHKRNNTTRKSEMTNSDNKIRKIKELSRQFQKAGNDLSVQSLILEEVGRVLGEHIKGLHYNTLQVTLAVMLRVLVNMGGRSTVKVMQVINLVIPSLLGKIPCANTVDNWLRRCGLDDYNDNVKQIAGDDYSLIVDESMMVGSSKLLVNIAAPAKHVGHTMTHADACIVGIHTSESFNALKVYNAINECAEKVGTRPKYVVSDNASIMKAGVALSELPHHPDISHTLGMYLERTYKKDDEFNKYCDQMSDIKFRHNMKKIAYILPPTQRTIARFINMDAWVKWSMSVLESYHLFGKEEQEALGFVRSNASLIYELSEVMECVKFIEHECKQHGLSKDTVRLCRKHLARTIMSGNPRMRRFAVDVDNFLKKEVSWMDDDDSHNNSSDIVESTFGIYKNRKSPNKLYGVTSMVLLIPIYEKLSEANAARTYKFKEHLEAVKMKDLKAWEKGILPSNLVSKRQKVLSPEYGYFGNF